MGRKKHPEPLTPAEQRVLEELRTGATNAEIAVRMGLSINTVKYHVANMLAKTGLTDRAELRSWRMPRDGGPNWWLRGAVAVGGLVGIVAFVSLSLLTSREQPSREAWIAYPTYDRGPTDLVRMVEVQSGKARELRAEGGWLFVTLEWSPDGQWLAAGVAKTGSEATELRIYERESFALHGTIPNAIAPFWSPDSARIAALGDRRLVLAAPDGTVLANGSFDLGWRSGNPAWSSNGRWLVIFSGNQVWTWDRDGNTAQLEPENLDWPITPVTVQVGWFLESGELFLIGQFTPAGEGAATPVFASFDLDTNDLTILNGFPQTGDPLYEFATISASRPDLVLRPPEISVEGRGRYYMTHPSNQQPAEDIRLIVVTGAGNFELKAPGFSGLDRKSFSLVLIGDWPEPPPLAVPTAIPSP